MIGITTQDYPEAGALTPSPPSRRAGRGEVKP
jgi:hypothetical protein